ncbi:MAG TPA: hypothetical protein PK198_08095 [Saprospiraceae bacterium]|nr:hypothetical protein [Saprospiraceae bacterium]
MKDNKISTLIKDWRTAAVLCLTLGLAPFFPEPHIQGSLDCRRRGRHGTHRLVGFLYARVALGVFALFVE